MGPGLRTGELLREGRFTLSILVAPGRFLGLLVSVTLIKLWKAADLERKKAGSGVREAKTFWKVRPSLPHVAPLPFALFLQPGRLVATLGHEEKNSRTVGKSTESGLPRGFPAAPRSADSSEG